MIGIVKICGQRIVKYRDGFVEGYPMFLKVTLGLLTTPSNSMSLFQRKSHAPSNAKLSRHLALEGEIDRHSYGTLQGVREPDRRTVKLSRGVLHRDVAPALSVGVEARGHVF